MEVVALEKPSASSAYGQGSGILGALNSNALASRPAGSNIQRLGSKMVIPSAIDSSGLIDVASISRQPNKHAPSASGMQLTAAILQPRPYMALLECNAEQKQRHL